MARSTERNIGIECCFSIVFVKFCLFADIEPLLLLILAYISYLLGELFDWSAIIAYVQLREILWAIWIVNHTRVNRKL